MFKNFKNAFKEKAFFGAANVVAFFAGANRTDDTYYNFHLSAVDLLTPKNTHASMNKHINLQATNYLMHGLVETKPSVFVKRTFVVEQGRVNPMNLPLDVLAQETAAREGREETLLNRKMNVVTRRQYLMPYYRVFPIVQRVEFPQTDKNEVARANAALIAPVQPKSGFKFTFFRSKKSTLSK